MSRFYVLLFISTILFACDKAKETVPEYKPSITNSIGMNLNYIPPGTFMMGPKNECKLGVPGEVITQHKVTLTKGFYIQTTETTVGQWKQFIDATGYKTQAEKKKYVWLTLGNHTKKIVGGNWRNPGFHVNNNHPVIFISWEDTQEFINWLNKKTEKNYRLPTEAEWEYACRAGSTTHFIFGNLDIVNNNIDLNRYSNSELSKYAWYGENSYGNPHEVGQKKSNLWGLYDMYGNVAEFCIDFFQNKYQEHEIDPVHLKKTIGRVIKGGDYAMQSYYSTSSVVHWVNPDEVSSLFGFRIVKDVDKNDIIRKEEK